MLVAKFVFEDIAVFLFPMQQSIKDVENIRDSVSRILKREGAVARGPDLVIPGSRVGVLKRELVDMTHPVLREDYKKWVDTHFATSTHRLQGKPLPLYMKTQILLVVCRWRGSTIWDVNVAKSWKDQAKDHFVQLLRAVDSGSFHGIEEEVLSEWFDQNLGSGRSKQVWFPDFVFVSDQEHDAVALLEMTMSKKINCIFLFLLYNHKEGFAPIAAAMLDNTTPLARLVGEDLRELNLSFGKAPAAVAVAPPRGEPVDADDDADDADAAGAGAGAEAGAAGSGL
jgi:hypothetical protein